MTIWSYIGPKHIQDWPASCSYNGNARCMFFYPVILVGILTFTFIQDIKVYLNERPTAYLDELSWFIWDEYEVVATESTISRALKKIKWSRKAVYLSFSTNNLSSLRKQLQNRTRMPGMTGYDVSQSGMQINQSLLMNQQQMNEQWIENMDGHQLEFHVKNPDLQNAQKGGLFFQHILWTDISLGILFIGPTIPSFSILLSKTMFFLFAIRIQVHDLLL